MVDCKYGYKDINIDNVNWGKIYCKTTNSICPFQYFCKTINGWRNHNSLHNKCITYKNKEDDCIMAEGKYKVIYSKGSKLCVKVDENTTIFLENPFNEVPKTVSLIRYKNEYKIKKTN